MGDKIKEPVLDIQPLPPGWVSAECEDPEDPLSSSSAQLPEGVNEVKQQTFVPPSCQRGEGQPSAALKSHLDIDSARRGKTFTTVSMMLKLFLFFFCMTTLDKVAEFTNEKALEIVIKLPYIRSDGLNHFKVVLHVTYIYTNTHYHTPVAGSKSDRAWRLQRASSKRMETLYGR